MIQIIPAIDIIDGRCVRLTQGDYGRQKTYDQSPLEMAKAYAGCGITRIHLVDLDGAKKGEPANLKVLESIASALDMEVEWGGGISSAQALASVFDAGCAHAIIGSVAALKPELFEEWLRSFGPSKIVLGADVREGKVAVKGWLEDSAVTIEDLMDRFCPQGLREVICTDISKDGMLQGPDCGFYRRLQDAYPGASVIVSGGISSMADIMALNSIGLGKVIVGKAIYEGRITLQDIERWSQKG